MPTNIELKKYIEALEMRVMTLEKETETIKTAKKVGKLTFHVLVYIGITTMGVISFFKSMKELYQN